MTTYTREELFLSLRDCLKNSNSDFNRCWIFEEDFFELFIDATEDEKSLVEPILSEYSVRHYENWPYMSRIPFLRLMYFTPSPKRDKTLALIFSELEKCEYGYGRFYAAKLLLEIGEGREKAIAEIRRLATSKTEPCCYHAKKFLIDKKIESYTSSNELFDLYKSLRLKYDESFLSQMILIKGVNDLSEEDFFSILENTNGSSLVEFFSHRKFKNLDDMIFCIESVFRKRSDRGVQYEAEFSRLVHSKGLEVLPSLVRYGRSSQNKEFFTTTLSLFDYNELLPYMENFLSSLFDSGDSSQVEYGKFISDLLVKIGDEAMPYLLTYVSKGVVPGIHQATKAILRIHSKKVTPPRQ